VFALVLLLGTKPVSMRCQSPSAMIDATKLWQKIAHLFFLAIDVHHQKLCFEFCRYRQCILSCLLVMLPNGIAFCAFFIAMRSAILPDLLILQAILASLDDGIDFIVDFFLQRHDKWIQC
jgi:hypothetical protein